MATQEVILKANEGIFEGLSKQNMRFHQCVAELVDNAIAAKRPDGGFRIHVILVPLQGDTERLDLYVADNGQGMDLCTLSNALQLGYSATTASRLNEHGFGLKNALATLSGGNGPWTVWSRPLRSNSVLSVDGPFRPTMFIEDDAQMPTAEYLPDDISTLIKVTVTKDFLRTVQGKGRPVSDLVSLRMWLIEHLGVFYRGYLEQDPATGENSGAIFVAIGQNCIRVLPVTVPLANSETRYIDVELGDTVTRVQYVYGTLDETKRDNLVLGKKARFYYQNNVPTQGIDIRLGKRVITTRAFEAIWKTENGESELSRHNSYNEFLGELLIPELPRGVLSTVNNKSDLNLDDPDWAKLFEILNTDYRPIPNIRAKTEAGLRDKWMKILTAANPDDEITSERAVWPTGTKIDVYQKTVDGRVFIYELKAGTASPVHLYQLKMYWDGLLLDKKMEQPKEAVLLVEDFSSGIKQMAKMMNSLPVPKNSKPYNFKVERHKDKQL